MSEITTDKFRRFVKDVTPAANPDGIGLSKRSRHQYVVRTSLVWLIDYAMSEYALSNTQKLRIARDLSEPEVDANPERWAARFEEKATETERQSTPMSLIYSLASDVCGMLGTEPQGDHATATDGNGDIAA